MKTLDALIATLKQAKEELAKAKFISPEQQKANRAKAVHESNEAAVSDVKSSHPAKETKDSHEHLVGKTVGKLPNNHSLTYHGHDHGFHHYSIRDKSGAHKANVFVDKDGKHNISSSDPHLHGSQIKEINDIHHNLPKSHLNVVKTDLEKSRNSRSSWTQQKKQEGLNRDYTQEMRNKGVSWSQAKPDEGRKPNQNPPSEESVQKLKEKFKKEETLKTDYNGQWNINKAIKPGPTLDYNKINPKPDRAAQEAAAPSIDYGSSRMSTPKINAGAGAAERTATTRAKLDAEGKESALQTINRRRDMNKEETQKNINASYQTGTNTIGAGDDMAMSEKEPHKDPHHEEKEKKAAGKIKREAEDILDMHKYDTGQDIMAMSANGQWNLVKAPVSEAQRKAMWAAASGHSNLGIPKSVGKDYAEKDPGGKLPEKKEAKKSELEKDNSVKPFGQNIYNSTANIKRKANRTGEVVEGVGRNNATHSYTTSGSSMNAAHEAATAKEMKAKTKASTRTLKDMSPEEKAKIEAQYGAKIKKD